MKGKIEYETYKREHARAVEHNLSVVGRNDGYEVLLSNKRSLGVHGTRQEAEELADRIAYGLDRKHGCYLANAAEEP